MSFCWSQSGLLDTPESLKSDIFGRLSIAISTENIEDLAIQKKKKSWTLKTFVQHIYPEATSSLVPPISWQHDRLYQEVLPRTICLLMCLLKLMSLINRLDIVVPLTDICNHNSGMSLFMVISYPIIIFIVLLTISYGRYL